MRLNYPRLRRPRFCHRAARQSEKSLGALGAHRRIVDIIAGDERPATHGAAYEDSCSRSLILVLSLACARAAEPGLGEGTKLANKYNCQSCHLLDKPSAGPSFRAIAKRYASDPNAQGELETTVRNGSTGALGAHANAWGGRSRARPQAIRGIHFIAEGILSYSLRRIAEVGPPARSMLFLT
jgi:cytochrome c551/c552